MTFERWKAAVNEQLDRLIGLSTDDLADAPYYDMFEDGDTPLQAARSALRAEGF